MALERARVGKRKVLIRHLLSSGILQKKTNCRLSRIWPRRKVASSALRWQRLRNEDWEERAESVELALALVPAPQTGKRQLAPWPLS